MNPFIRYDQRLEDFVRSYVKGNFPTVNQTGVLSGTKASPGRAPNVATNNENGSAGGKPLFVWGVSRWGSNTYVISN